MPNPSEKFLEEESYLKTTKCNPCPLCFEEPEKSSHFCYPPNDFHIIQCVACGIKLTELDDAHVLVEKWNSLESSYGHPSQEEIEEANRKYEEFVQRERFERDHPDGIHERYIREQKEMAKDFMKTLEENRKKFEQSYDYIQPEE